MFRLAQSSPIRNLLPLTFTKLALRNTAIPNTALTLFKLTSSSFGFKPLSQIYSTPSRNFYNPFRNVLDIFKASSGKKEADTEASPEPAPISRPHESESENLILKLTNPELPLSLIQNEALDLISKNHIGGDQNRIAVINAKENAVVVARGLIAAGEVLTPIHRKLISEAGEYAEQVAEGIRIFVEYLDHLGDKFPQEIGSDIPIIAKAGQYAPVVARAIKELNQYNNELNRRNIELVSSAGPNAISVAKAVCVLSRAGLLDKYLDIVLDAKENAFELASGLRTLERSQLSPKEFYINLLQKAGKNAKTLSDAFVEAQSLLPDAIELLVSANENAFCVARGLMILKKNNLYSDCSLRALIVKAGNAADKLAKGIVILYQNQILGDYLNNVKQAPESTEYIATGLVILKNSSALTPYYSERLIGLGDKADGIARAYARLKKSDALHEGGYCQTFVEACYNKDNALQLAEEFAQLQEANLLRERFCKEIVQSSRFEGKAQEIIKRVQDQKYWAKSFLKQSALEGWWIGQIHFQAKTKIPNIYCPFLDSADEHSDKVAQAFVYLKCSEILTPDYAKLVLKAGSNAVVFARELIELKTKGTLTLEHAEELSKKWINPEIGLTKQG